MPQRSPPVTAHRSNTRRGLAEPRTATITMAANTGLGSCSKSGARNSSVATNTRPATMLAIWLRAPLAAEAADFDRLPLTVSPPTKPLATLLMPLPTSS